MSEETHVVHEKRSEWPQFLLLVIVAVGVIVGVALLRPFIFGRIVPAILGPSVEKTTISLPIIGSEEEPEEVEEPLVEEETDTEEEAGASQDDEAETVEGEGEGVVEEETAEPQIHIVQPGQTLNQIARRYEVSVAALIEANKLTNPDVLRIGQEIVIPQEE